MAQANDDAARLARIRYLCSVVDDVRAQAQRVFRDINSRSSRTPGWPQARAETQARTGNTRGRDLDETLIQGDSER